MSLGGADLGDFDDVAFEVIKSLTLKIEPMQRTCIPSVQAALNVFNPAIDLATCLVTIEVPLDLSDEEMLIEVQAALDDYHATLGQVGSRRVCSAYIPEDSHKRKRTPDVVEMAIPEGDSVNIGIPTMACRNCVDALTSAFQALDFLTEHTVDLETKTATLRFSPAFDREVAARRIQEAVDNAGHEVTVPQKFSRPA